MKRLLLIGIVSLCGCVLDAEYVEADRETWRALRPVIQAGIEVQPDKDDREAYKLLDDSWKARWTAGAKKHGL